MKVKIEEETCIGCGLCADTCPEVFALLGDHAAVKVEPVPPDQEDCAREAAENCPVTAILIEE